MAGQLLLIFGATGFSGQLIARTGLEWGLQPVLAGRNADRLRSLGDKLGLKSRVGEITDAAGLDRLLDNIAVVINCAGPYSVSAMPIVNACFRTGTHYLDVSGEAQVSESLRLLDDRATNDGVMLMPGAGFSSVPSDCLANTLLSRMPDAVSISVGLAGIQAASRGSLASMVEQAGGVCIRREGKLVRSAPGQLRHAFDYGEGPSPSLAISMADTVGPFHSTRVPNITVFMEETPQTRSMMRVNATIGDILARPPWQAAMKAIIGLLPEGPTDRERAEMKAAVTVELRNESGSIVSARVHTPEVYTFTAIAAVTCARRVLNGDVRPGFQTPSLVFGSEFARTLPGTRWVAPV